MHNFEELDALNSTRKQHQPWGQIFLSIAAITITFVGAKIEGFNWILYFAVPMLAGSFLLAIQQTSIASSVREYITNKKDKKIIKETADEYIEFFEQLSITKELIEAIQKLDWAQIKQPRHNHPHNRLIDLAEIMKSRYHSNYSKSIFLNHVLNLHIEGIDSFIQECDHLVAQREVMFKHEQDKSKLQKLIRRYDDFRERHNLLCKKINKKCSKIYFRQFYDQDFSFMPKEVIYRNDETIVNQ